MAAMGRIELTRDLTAKFDLGFNLKTAKIFGLTIAQWPLLRAGVVAAAVVEEVECQNRVRSRCSLVPLHCW